MIPLSDASRRPVNFPIVTVLVIAANVLMFLLELALGDAFINRWSLVPADIMAGRNWITILTALFMHAGWAHILGNMLFFWVFGPEIEDVMGPSRYLLFYLLSGLAATAAQVLIDPTSSVPNLGASGAIAGVMGAFLITYPRDRIRTLLFIGWFGRVTFIPAAILVGFWFLTQLFNEVGALAQVQSGGVAYMAHIGGFIFGALMARVFETRTRRYRQGLPE
jgi:membrane associated rhomboid family serine protease